MLRNSGSRLILLTCFCTILTGSGHAAPGAAAEAAPPLNAQQLRAFFETQAPALMKERNIAGLSVAAGAGGRTLYTGGFGHADANGEVPVEPARTLFRAGSVSKLFVWRSVMQLVRSGKLDLDEDVNTYLARGGEFQLPAMSAEPVTLRHLMHHTAGFEDRLIGLFTKDPGRTVSLETAATENVPLRVRAPGVAIAYSNYGSTLAAYIVQIVSGEPFAAYVERTIFSPLRMSHSTFAQPGNDPSGEFAKLEADLATGLVPVEDGTFLAQEFEIVQDAPAGALSTTATDLLTFLQSSLSSGETSGWLNLSRNGELILGHSGNTIYFNSAAIILPEHDLAVFFVNNTAGGGVANMELTDRFLNRFFPAPDGRSVARAAGVTVSQADLEQYYGHYSANRRAEDEITKIISLFTSTYVRAPSGESANAVDTNSGGASGESLPGLELFDFFYGEYVYAVPVGGGIFQEAGGQRRYRFLPDGGLIFEELPVFTLVRPPWYELPPLHYMILFSMVAAVLTALIFRPTGLLTLLPRGSFRHGPDNDARTAARLALGTPLCYVAFLFTAGLAAGDFIFTEPARWPLAIPYIALLLNLAALAYLFPVWSRSFWTAASRVHFTLLVLVPLPFFWFLYFWNMLL